MLAVGDFPRASKVGGDDLDADPSYIEDWALRGLAVNTASSSTASTEYEQVSCTRSSCNVDAALDGKCISLYVLGWSCCRVVACEQG